MQWTAELVDLVLGEGRCVDVALERIAAGGAAAWPEIVERARRCGVVPDLARPEIAARVPATATARLRTARAATAVASTLVLRRGIRIFGQLEEAQIAAVAVKGVGMMTLLGCRPDERTTCDLDVVVAESEVARARAVLRAGGWRELDGDVERHVGEIARSRQLHNFARTFVDGGVDVDLHWRFGPRPPFALDAARLLTRRVRATWRGHALWVADPLDGVLISVHHALRGSFAHENAIRDLADLKRWWESGLVAPRLDELVASAIRSELAVALLALCAAILRRAPAHGLGSLRTALQAALAPTRVHEAVLLERYFEHTLAHGLPARFTLELFAPRLYARSQAASLRGWTRGLHRPPSTEEPPPFARRSVVGRIADLVPRVRRVVRELGDLRTLRAYRALARTQSKFH